jgi:ABC-type transporter Mla subunit MlaD
MWNKTVSVFKDVRHILIAILLAVLIYQTIFLPKVAERAVASLGVNDRLDRLENGLANTNSHVNGVLDQTQALVKDAKDSLDDNYWEMKAQANSTTVILRDTSDLIHDFRVNLFGGKDTQGAQQTGLMVEARGLLVDARSLTKSLQDDLHKVMTTTDKDLQTLDQTLGNIASLTNTLESQIKEGGPEARKTVASLNQAIIDLDKLLADEHIKSTLAHVDSSAESVDIMMRPWRARAGLLKIVLQKAVGIFKIAWAF